MLVRKFTTKSSGQYFDTIRGFVTAISLSCRSGGGGSGGRGSGGGGSGGGGSGGGGSGGGGSGGGDLLLSLSSTANAAVSLIFVTETPGCDLLTVSERVVAEV